MTKIFVLFSLMLSLAACQQGEKKSSSAIENVQADVTSAQSISDELATHKVMLKGSIPNENDTLPALPDQVSKSDEESAVVESLLERFITTASKVQSLADDKVVNFTSIGEINIEIKRASRYLGHIYSRHEWSNEDSPVQTPLVDYAEYGDRSMIMGAGFRHLKALIAGDYTDISTIQKALKKMNTTTLRALGHETLDTSLSCNRMTTLLKRNNGWGSPTFKVMEDQMPKVALAYAMYFGAICDEMTARHETL